jgi:hypothetical protein
MKKLKKSKRVVANQSEFGFAGDNLGTAPKPVERRRIQRAECFADKLPPWLREPIKLRKKVRLG